MHQMHSGNAIGMLVFCPIKVKSLAKATVSVVFTSLLDWPGLLVRPFFALSLFEQHSRR